VNGKFLPAAGALNGISILKEYVVGGNELSLQRFMDQA